MVVLAFLTNPDILRKILGHLGLPTTAPAVTKARSSVSPLGFDLPEPDPGSEPAQPHEREMAGEDGEFVRPPP